MKRKRQEGAALFLVLMIVMVGTASAVFAANTAATEVRSAGFARQQLQTGRAARAGLLGALEWMEIFGPLTIRDMLIAQNQGVDFECDATECFPEVPLADGRQAYRIYPEHFQALVAPGVLAAVPYEGPSSFGPRSALAPLVLVDIYDERITTRLAPGVTAQGGTKFNFLRASVTARGRSTVVGGDVTNAQDNRDGFNSGGGDMRAYTISGPFVTGS